MFVFACYIITNTQVKGSELNEDNNLMSSTKSLKTLLKLVKTTCTQYDSYLTPNLNNSDAGGVLNKNQMKEAISKCQQEYNKIVSDNVKVVSNNSNIVSLDYNMNNIKDTIQNKLITIKTPKCDDRFDENFGNIKFSKNETNSYSICQFDLKYTKLSDGSIIDFDNKHIKIGSQDSHCWALMLPDKKHVQGYKSGQHCFRMFYKNKVVLFGIHQHGDGSIKSVQTTKTSWGIVNFGNGKIYCNGERGDDASSSFLYTSGDNQIDMLVDFDKGILSYCIIDDKETDRKYTFTKRFDTSIFYTISVGLYYRETQVQIAKINVDMFGKNKKLVKWPIRKY